MKIRFLEKLFLFVVGACLALYACLWIFINVKGKDLLINQLKEVTKKNVDIGSVDFRPFLGVRIDDINIDGATVEELGISLSLMYLLRGTIGFNAITVKDVEVKVTRDKQGVSTSFTPFPLPVSKDNSLRSIKDKDAQSAEQAKKIPKFFARRITLDHIRVDFEDSSNRDKFEGSLYDIRATIKNIGYPGRYRTNFDITSDMKLGGFLLEDNLSFKGYIDFRDKSMDAALIVRKLPYKSFSAYYPPFWKPDNLGVEEADFSLDSEFKAVDNDLTVHNNLHLTSHRFSEKEEGQSKVPLMQAILSLVDKDSQGKPTLYFQMQTKLDSPRLDFSLVEAQLRAKAKELPIMMGGQAIAGVTGKGKEAAAQAMDVTGGAVEKIFESPDKAKEILKETGKILKSIFVPEEESQAPQENTSKEQE